MFSKFFPENRAVYERMSKNVVDSIAHARSILDKYVYTSEGAWPRPRTHTHARARTRTEISNT
jgi:hypothetical protein